MKSISQFTKATLLKVYASLFFLISVGTPWTQANTVDIQIESNNSPCIQVKEQLNKIEDPLKFVDHSFKVWLQDMSDRYHEFFIGNLVIKQVYNKWSFKPGKASSFIEDNLECIKLIDPMYAKLIDLSFESSEYLENSEVNTKTVSFISAKPFVWPYEPRNLLHSLIILREENLIDQLSLLDSYDLESTTLVPAVTEQRSGEERTYISNQTPLHLAVIFGRIEIVKKLLERGVNIYTRNANCDTALILARKVNALGFDRTEIIQLLQNAPEMNKPKDKNYLGCNPKSYILKRVDESFLVNNSSVESKNEANNKL